MTDELRLPPRRELPPEVRDRMRATVTRGLAQRPQRRRVLAAAAAVVVFVVGAVVVTQSARPPRTAPVAVAPSPSPSPAGKALASCLNHVSQRPADRDAYAPGALLTDGKYQVVLGRSPGHTVACVAEPDPANPAASRYQVYLDTFLGESIPVRRLSVPGLGPNAAKVPFVGIAPYAAAFLVVDFGPGSSVNIPVTHGTFAIWLPAGAQPESDGNVHVDAMGGNRTGLFNGGIPMH